MPAAMITIHSEHFGDSYVAAIEQAAKQNYKFGGTKNGGGKQMIWR